MIGFQDRSQDSGPPSASSGPGGSVHPPEIQSRTLQMSEDTQSPLQPPGIAELPENVAAMLAIVVPPVTGVAFWFLDRNRRLVRFYAMQTILLGIAAVVSWMAVGILGVVHSNVHELFLVGPFLALVHGLLLLAVGAAYVAAIVIQLLKAWRREEWELPFLGAQVTKMLAKPAALT